MDTIIHWLYLTAVLFLLSQNPTTNVLARYYHFNNTTTTSTTSHSQSALPVASEASNALPLSPAISSSHTIFNVTAFGAVGDGSTDDTAAFTEAWRAACAVESGLVLAPSNHTFMICSIVFYGPCQPGLVFQVDGVLMPLNGPESWPESDSIEQWLVFYQLDGMRLTGAGTIEGRGHQWWKLPCKPHQAPNGSTLPGPCISPSLIRFFMSSNLVVTKLRINNSPEFHIKFDSCQGVRINGLSISSPKHSPNTDGIHIENTQNVVIHNSIIASGDDCISIGSGSRNVDIKNVTCGPSHGISQARKKLEKWSIGSLGIHNSQACVSNITVRKSHIKNSDNGLRIKTWQGGSGSVRDVSFHDIRMENVLNCMMIDQYYCLTGDCENQTMAVQLTDVSYRNIKGTYNPLNPPFHFACSDAMPCTNITMSQVELLPHQQGEWAEEDPLCWNAYGTQETLTIPPIDCLLDGEPDTVGEASTHGCY